MTRRIVARWVITHRAPCVLVRGRDAGRVLRAHGFKPLWSQSAHGHVLDDEHLADIAAIAGLCTLGYRVTHEDGTECEHATLRGPRREVDLDPSDDDLCVCAGERAALADLLADQLGAVEIGHVHRRPA